jgi:hypothetical protein
MPDYHSVLRLDIPEQSGWTYKGLHMGVETYDLGSSPRYRIQEDQVAFFNFCSGVVLV